LDRLLKIRQSESAQRNLAVNDRTAERRGAMEARIAACFWCLGQKASATPLFQDLLGEGGTAESQAPSADMPQALLQAWQQAKMDLQRQQPTNEPAPDQVKPSAATDEAVPPKNTPVSTALGPAPDPIREFFRKFMKAGESAAPDARVEFYAPTINRYYDNGKIQREQIPAIEKGYFAKWPNRSFVPNLDSLSVTENSPGIFSVRLPFQYALSNGKKTAKGTSILVCTITMDLGRFLRITEINETKP